MSGAVTEHDYELIESYLDDELSPAEVDDLRKRIADEPELAAAMEQVRFEREARQTLFAALEPDAQSVQRLISGVRKDVRRQVGREWTRRAMKFVSSAAALLLVGFFSGYVSRGGPATGGGAAGIGGGGGNEVARQVVFPANQQNSSNATGGYQLALYDESGNVIGVQRFRSLQEAQEFKNDLARQQTQHRQQMQNGGLRLISDQY